MLLSRSGVGILSLALMLLNTGVTSSQNYPYKPVRIVTAAPGGGSDFQSRQIASGISGPLGQAVIVDNRGGGSILSETIVAKAPPDGYSLLVAGGGLWITPLLIRVSYDVLRDFSPISLISREVLVVAVHPSVSANSVKELIALAKAKPGNLNFASGSISGPLRLGGELFKNMVGINIVNVPYKGNPQAVAGLVAGEVQMIFVDAGLVSPHVTSGRLKALAVTSASPSALAPGLPTVAASGVPGYEWVAMTGIYATGKTPAEIINRLNREIVRFLTLPEVKERFINSRMEIIASSPEEFTEKIKFEMAKTGKIIKDAGIKVD